MKIGLRDIKHLAIIGGAGAAGVVATLVVFEAVERPHSQVITVETHRAPTVHVRSNVHVVKPVRERSDEEAGVRLRRFEVRAAEKTMTPIVYIDGVRVDGPGLHGEEPSRLDDLSPEDIAKIDVVKGDKALEYGTEAKERGVILVTTKTGKKKDSGEGS